MGLSSLRRHYLGSPSAPTSASPRSYSAADHVQELADLRKQLRQERDGELEKLIDAHKTDTAALHARIAELEAELAMVSARSTLPAVDTLDEHRVDEPKPDPRVRRGR